MFPFFLPFIHVLPGMQSEGIVCWSGPLPSSESKTREPPRAPHTAGRGAQARDRLGSDGDEGVPGPESYQEFRHGDGGA